MKKLMAIALVASFMLVSATAFAAEIPNPFDLKFDGSVTVQYRNDKVTNSDPLDANYNVPRTFNGFKILGVLNATKKLSDNVDFYGRFTYETFTGGNLDRYGSAHDYAGSYSGAAIDAFGLKIASGGWNWTVGSQALTIGQGLVYDNGFIGRHALPWAVDAKGKMGVINTDLFWARTNYQSDLKNDTFYGVQLGYDVSPKANIGAFYTSWKAGNSVTATTNFTKDSINYYGINTVLAFDDKLTFNGEYAKSSADNNNKAYIAGLSYKLDKKSKFAVSYYRVEDLADVNDGNFGGITTAPNANTKGYILSYSNKLGSDTTLKVGYDSYTHIKDAAATGAGASNDRNRTTVGLTFVF